VGVLVTVHAYGRHPGKRGVQETLSPALLLHTCPNTGTNTSTNTGSKSGTNAGANTSSKSGTNDRANTMP